MTATDEVLAWARGYLDGQVEVEQIKVRPWAATWRLRSRDGVSFLKAAGIASRYEAPLMATLHRRAPDLVAEVLAVDVSRGLLLLADAGPTLAEHLDRRFESAAWERMVARFGELQRLATSDPEDLIEAGVPDERPHQLAAVLARLLDTSPEAARLTASERSSLIGNHWARAAAELAQLPVPAAVQHGDLHAGNVSIGPRGDFRFFDLGDASVAHPFTAMLVPLRTARALGAGDAEVERLRDRYLDVFTDLAPLPALRRGLDVALRCGLLTRATAWDRALRGAPTDRTHRQDHTDHPGQAWGEPVLEYLRELQSAGV